MVYCPLTNKTNVKSCIVGNKNTISTPFNKIRKFFIFQWCIFYHIVSYFSKFYYFFIKFSARINKSRISIYYFSLFYFYSTDFYYFIYSFSKTGSFQVKNYIGIIKTLAFGIGNNITHIIYHIAFTAIENLNPSFVSNTLCIRERLYNAMVSNTYCLMTPVLSSVYISFYWSNSIHHTHICMKMEFNSFFRSCIFSYFWRICCIKSFRS